MDRRIEVITAMEKWLNEGRRTVDELREMLGELRLLFDYYGSPEWFSDRELDIPADVSCGVLTEDAVYDLIIDCTELRRELEQLVK